MDRTPEQRRRGRVPSEPLSGGGVPERAALTELARGFLLSSSSDRDQATRFAATFLREVHGSPKTPQALPPEKLAYVRRGIASIFRAEDPP
jgi:hypothetical protein